MIAIRLSLVLTLLVLSFSLGTKISLACSCAWGGGFLEAAPHSLAMVRVSILEHLPNTNQEPVVETSNKASNTQSVIALTQEPRISQSPGSSPREEQVSRGEAPTAMKVKVVDVLWTKNGVLDLELDKSYLIQGDNGMLCRLPISNFPVGSDWLIGLNGPGSKPGYDSSLAVSSCGCYAVRIDDRELAVGNISTPSSPQSVEEMPYAELRHKILSAPLREKIVGSVVANQPFYREFGGKYLFRLEPIPTGWQIVVQLSSSSEDLSRLTPPLHFVPNPRDLEGWHFRNADNTGPNETGDKNVNAPQETRDFIFFPQSISNDMAQAYQSGNLPSDLSARLGHGTLRINDYELGNLEPNKQAIFSRMKFEVYLEWFR